MKATDDLEPLIELADDTFEELLTGAHLSIARLASFWTRLYGPNEAFEAATENLAAVEREWNHGDEDGYVPGPA